jgi:hypothetical protein
MKKLFFLLILLLIPNLLFAAGSCTVSTEKQLDLVYVVWDWLSDASGDVDDASCISTPLTGIIVGVITKPDATAAPSDNYDVDIADSTDVVITGTYLDNRDTANIERVTPVQADGNKINLYRDPLELIVANAGNAKQGQLVLVVYPFEF